MGIIIKRIAQAIPLLFVVITVNFLIIHLAPGDPIYSLLGEGADANFIAQMKARWGLDQPLYVQYIKYISRVFQGDLGYSLLRSESVASLIVDRLQATLLLIFSAICIAVLVGIFLGVIASKKPYSLRDNLITGFSLLGTSIPLFWLGQILLIIFGVYLGILPISGMTNVRLELTGLDYALDVARHLILPAATLAIFFISFVTRLTRASMLEVLGQDFIITARSKGLSDMAVTYKHALRNALLPVMTYVGLSIGLLFGGAILTETVFSWPGMGRLLYDSLKLRDYPVIQGIFVFVCIIVMISNLIVDILYGILDPRIRSK